MKTMSRKAVFPALGVIALFLTTGCNGDQLPEQEQPPTTQDGDTPEVEPTASIFGPGAEVPEPEPALEPLLVTIGFPDGGAELDAAALEALQTVLESEQFALGQAITLGGHSDAGGDDAANLRASQKRAEAVRAWLIEKGVAEERLTLVAFGEQNPAEPNALPDGSPNEAGRAANRRVEIVVEVPPTQNSSPDSSEAEPSTELGN